MVDASGVVPLSQSIDEAGSAAWSGSLALVDATDGTPVSIGWDFDDEIPSHTTICDENSGDPIPCTSWCSYTAFSNTANVIATSSTRAFALADLNGDRFPDLVSPTSGTLALTVRLGNGDGTFRFGGTYPAPVPPCVLPPYPIPGVCVGDAILEVTAGDFNGDGVADAAVGYQSHPLLPVMLGSGDGSLQPPIENPLYAPFGRQARDMDGDGVDDLVLGLSGITEVLLGNGDGSLGAAVGIGSHSIASGDFDGDGTADLAVTNPGANTILVFSTLRGHHWAPPRSFATGATPSAVATTDLDGDGDLDLVVSDRDGAAISVLLGNGDGTFAAHVDYPTTYSPTRLAVGDVNGDGWPDVAVLGAATVSVLLGNGAGGFAGRYDASLNQSLSDIALADVNGDLRADLIVGTTKGTVLTLLARPDGTLQRQFLPGSVTAGTSIDDMNGDGIPDVVSVSSSFLTVDLGDGERAFNLQTTQLADSASAALTADLNGDGNADLVTVGSEYQAAIVNVYYGNGDGTVQKPPVSFATSATVRSAKLADVNEDGAPDLLIVDTQAANLTVMLNDGSGGFLPGIDYPAATPYRFDVGDVNEDGAPDVVIANGSAVSILLGAGDGSFGAESDYAALPGPISVAVADIDGDGHLDIAVANNDPGGSSVLPGDGTGAFPSSIGLGPGTRASAVAVADLTEDGYPDVVLAGANLVVVPGAAGFNFGAPSSTVLGGADYVAVADFDRDGHLDVTTPVFSHAASIFYGYGDGSFALNVGGTSMSLAVGDADRDGAPDVAAADVGGSAVSVFRGRGDGSFHPRVDWPTTTRPIALIEKDVDGDGFLDLVSLSSNKMSVSLLSGRGDGTFNAAADFPMQGSVLASGDFDGNGRDDLVGATTLLGVLWGETGGGFRTNFATIGGAGAPQAIADFNGDGKLDVAVTHWSAAGTLVSILLGHGDGTVTPGPEYLPGGQNAASLVTGDFDRNGTADLAVSDRTLASIFTLLGAGDGTFVPGPPTSTGPNPGAMGTLDVNHDGVADLVVSEDGDSEFRLFVGRGDGTFRFAQAFGVGTRATVLSIDDVNLDGNPDVVMSDYATRNVLLIPGEPATWNCPIDTTHAFFDSKGTGPGPSFTWHATLVANASTSGAASITRDVTVHDLPPDPPSARGPGGSTLDVPEGGYAVAWFSGCDVGNTGAVPKDALTIHVEWGDGTSTDAPLGPPRTCTDETALAHEFPNGGDYTVLASAVDDEGLSGAPGQPLSVHVLDTPPIIAAVLSNSPVEVGQPASIWIVLQSSAGDHFTYDFAWDGDSSFDGVDDVVGLATNSASFASATARTITIPVRVRDDDGNSAEGSVDVTWLPRANHAPVAQSDAVTTSENTPLAIGAATLLSNDSDPDGDTIAFTGATPPGHGTVAVNGTSLTYSPGPNYWGTDVFYYSIADSFGAAASAPVIVDVLHVNQPPTANPDTLATAEDHATTTPASALLANDVDPDGDALTVTGVFAPVNGSVALSSGMVTFTPTQLFDGLGSFEYTVTDGTLSATGTVSVSIVHVDHVPGTPGIVSPQSGMTIATATPALVVSAAPDADGDPLLYEFQCDESPTFDSPSLQVSGLVASTSFAPSALSEDTVWYWRARASDASAHGDWAIAHFTVNASDAPPTAPVPIAPVDGVTVEPSMTSLRVLDASDPDGTTRQYVFSISRDPAGTDVVEVSPPVDEAASETTWEPTTALPRGAHLFWRAWAIDEAGLQGPSSPVEEFSTAGGPHGGCSCSTTEAKGEPGSTGALAAVALLIGLMVRRHARGDVAPGVPRQDRHVFQRGMGWSGVQPERAGIPLSRTTACRPTTRTASSGGSRRAGRTRPHRGTPRGPGGRGSARRSAG